MQNNKTWRKQNTGWREEVYALEEIFEDVSRAKFTATGGGGGGGGLSWTARYHGHDSTENTHQHQLHSVTSPASMQYPQPLYKLDAYIGW